MCPLHNDFYPFNGWRPYINHVLGHGCMHVKVLLLVVTRLPIVHKVLIACTSLATFESTWHFYSILKLYLYFVRVLWQYFCIIITQVICFTCVYDWLPPVNLLGHGFSSALCHISDIHYCLSGIAISFFEQQRQPRGLRVIACLEMTQALAMARLLGAAHTSKMKRVQYRALKFVYNDFNTSFEELVARPNLPTLALHRKRDILVEVFKSDFTIFYVGLVQSKRR